ncbi:MAG: hypothetical protein ACRDWW_06390 [Acidimicrobiales bacterium]
MGVQVYRASGPTVTLEVLTDVATGMPEASHHHLQPQQPAVEERVARRIDEVSVRDRAERVDQRRA